MAGTWLLGFAGVRPGRSGSCSYLVLVAHAVQCASSRDSERPAWRVGLSTISYSIPSVYPYPTLQGRRERKRERGHSGLLFSPLLFFFFFPTPPAAGDSAGFNERLLVFVPVSRYVRLCNGIQHVRRTDEPQPNATKRNARQRSPIPIPPLPSPPRL